MNAPVAPIGSSVGLFAVVYLLYILANLSQRLGSVTKMKNYYRGFYAAIGLVLAAIVTRVAISSLALSPSGERLWTNPLLALIGYHLPLVAAIVISVMVTWRYWNWLLKEKLQ